MFVLVLSKALLYNGIQNIAGVLKPGVKSINGALLSALLVL